MILIAVMEGLCGVALGKQLIVNHSLSHLITTGLVLSAFMSNEEPALQTSIALFFPILLIGGVESKKLFVILFTFM